MYAWFPVVSLLLAQVQVRQMVRRALWKCISCASNTNTQNMREPNDAGRGAHEILQLHDKSEGAPILIRMCGSVSTVLP